ncbi:MAG: glucose dehydrogenase [Chloroflexi bacterium]|nr:MAG: glucose dehydrogenase [Chloroflexota bacterium]
MLRYLTPLRLVVVIIALDLALFAYVLRGSFMQQDIEFVHLVGGLNQPTYLTHAGDDRLFILERPGVIRVYQHDALLPEPFLDIRDLVQDTKDTEQGLLSLAFAPDYQTSGRFYVYYTGEAQDGDTVVARYWVSDGDPNRADADSAQIILTVEQPAAKHNGGQLSFGPDGYLYLSLGDGGNLSQPENAQDTSNLLGSIIRIDVRGDAAAYNIPPGNPFADDESVRPEIWSYGLRNPWRFSFDSATGDLYIADVGDKEVEEINIAPAGDAGGHNYGWPAYEGRHALHDVPHLDADAITFPAFEYPHTTGEGIVAANWRCAIIGGGVYHGRQLSTLQGKYIYADWCSGLLWSLEQRDDGWASTELIDTDFIINSFGEDSNGELYLLTGQGDVWRLAEK